MILLAVLELADFVRVQIQRVKDESTRDDDGIIFKIEKKKKNFLKLRLLFLGLYAFNSDDTIVSVPLGQISPEYRNSVCNTNFITMQREYSVIFLFYSNQLRNYLTFSCTHDKQFH